MTDRYEKVMSVVARLIKQSQKVISSIVHCHPMALKFGLPKDDTYWSEYDNALIRACDEFWILKLDNWNKSKGIKRETAYAKSLGKPISFLDPATLEIVDV